MPAELTAGTAAALLQKDTQNFLFCSLNIFWVQQKDFCIIRYEFYCIGFHGNRFAALAVLCQAVPAEQLPTFPHRKSCYFFFK